MAKDDFIVDKLAVDRDMQFVAIEFLFQQFICLKCWGASEKASTGLVLVYFRENQFDGHLIILLICISGFYFAFFYRVAGLWWTDYIIGREWWPCNQSV